MKQEQNKSDCDWLLIIIFLLFATGAIMVGYMSDNVDINSQLGPYLCKQNGYEFVKAEYEHIGIMYELSDESMLKIYCKNATTAPIDDGYLVLLK